MAKAYVSQQLNNHIMFLKYIRCITKLFMCDIVHVLYFKGCSYNIHPLHRAVNHSPKSEYNTEIAGR